MTEVHLQVASREKAGKQAAKSIRRNGQVPGVFYAHDNDPMSLSVNARELDKVLHTEVNILDVKFPDGKERKCIIKHVQRDPVTDFPVHVDIMGINLKEKVRLTIPILFEGTPIGVKDEGGILEHVVREVALEGLPLEIPEHITVDVSGLHLGQSITIANLNIPDVKIIADEHQVIANVVTAKAAVSAAASGEEVVEEAETAEADE